MMVNPDWQSNISADDWGDAIMLERYSMVVHIAQDIIERRWTVRQVAREYCIGKSTVSRWIDKYLKWLDNDLYHEVKNQLRFHKKHTTAWRRR